MKDFTNGQKQIIKMLNKLKSHSYNPNNWNIFNYVSNQTIITMHHLNIRLMPAGIKQVTNYILASKY